jgi:hypothetical protein
MDVSNECNTTERYVQYSQPAFEEAPAHSIHTEPDIATEQSVVELECASIREALRCHDLDPAHLVDRVLAVAAVPLFSLLSKRSRCCA